jgi:hypothetical protein
VARERAAEVTPQPVEVGQCPALVEELVAGQGDGSLDPQCPEAYGLDLDQIVIHATVSPARDQVGFLGGQRNLPVLPDVLAGSW